MRKELTRQREHLELIASENFVSDAVLSAMGSHLTNKYAEGYPGKRYYGGCQYVDIVEDLARERAKALFGAEHANVQPHSGAQANMAVYFAMLEPGDTVMGMNLSHGGHLTHGSPVNMSGKYFHFVPYGVTEEEEIIDYDALEKMALETKPKMIVAGASSYPRIIDFARLREIADRAGCLLMVDMAHIAGLVAAGEHPSPVPYADFVTTTTHKTLRGPRGSMILCKKEYAAAIDRAIFPGTQGGPLEHVIAGKAVCLKEAMTPEFKAYQQQIVLNARAMAAEFTKEGIRLVSGGTDNHLMLLDLTGAGVTGKRRSRRAARSGQHHGQQEHHSEGNAQPVCDQRRAHRYACGDDPRHEGSGNEADCRAHHARHSRGRRVSAGGQAGGSRHLRQASAICRLRLRLKWMEDDVCAKHASPF